MANGHYGVVKCSQVIWNNFNLQSVDAHKWHGIDVHGEGGEQGECRVIAVV